MDYLSVVLTFLFALILIHTIQALQNRRRNLPPGPMQLPLIGNLHLLSSQPHKSLAKLAKIHGPLMFIRLGYIDTLVVSSARVANEVLQKHDLVFSNRMIRSAGNVHDHPKYSVAMLPVGSRWRNLRKVMNRNIFSRSKLDANQHLRAMKVKELIEFCRKSSLSDQAVDVGHIAFCTTMNFLSRTIFSRDMDDLFSDSSKEFRDLIRNILIELGRMNVVDFYPFLEKLDPHGIRSRQMRYFEKIIHICHGLVEERLKQKRENSVEYGDVIDQLLAMSNESPEEMDREQIVHLCIDIFVAATDTTSTTVEWAMVEALKNPETMKKAKAELEEVIGKGKILNEEDIPRLPYLQCIVKETLRIHPAVPLNIRRVDQDTQVSGYIIPKNSQVLINLWAIGRDPEVWPNPSEFKPERFLESTVEIEVIQFGAGRRICPGLPLATRMIPVMVGSLLNNFDWKLEGGIGYPDLDMEEKFGLSLTKAQPLRAIPIPL